jgi:hypothetical protein
MDQTPEQLDWVKQNVDKLRQRGYDPERIELDPDGNIVEIPKYGYLETLARQGAKSILPTGASFAAGAAAAPFGAPLGPLGMAGAGLVGGLLGGGVTGFVQDKALDYIAPEFQEAARRSAEQNPKTAWLGDQATALATMKPNVRALANLSVLGKGAMNSPAMREALANAGINAGGALAGQGVNMLQGGDFEPGRFAADTVFGSIYTDPNKLGQRLGIKPSSDTTPLAKVKDLTYEQSEMQRARKGTPADADWAKLPPIQVEVASKAEEKLAASVREKADKDYTKWWKSETIPTDKMFTEMMNESKLTISPENLAKLREMPEAIAAMKSPEAFKDFVWSSSEEALQEAYAYKKKQGELLGADEAASAEKFRSLRDSAKLAADMQRGRLASQEGSPRELAAQMGAGRERSEALRTAEPYAPKGPDYAPGEVPPFIPEPVKPQSKAREVISKDFLKPSAEDVAKVAENESAMAKLQAEQDAVELAKLKDLEAADALTQEAKARLIELEKPFNERVKLNKALGLPEALAKASSQETPELAQARQNAKEAEALRDELYNRLSRSDADAGKPLTQAELARMTQVAAKRGLEVHFEDLGNNRGQYVLATKDGQPLLKVNPLTATIDTIAHEVGHDVFNRSASEGMQKSLMETAMGSDAYKRELAKRLEQGATPEQAHSIAAEEGLIDAFARAGNKTDASDIRAWFKAFKASVKHLAGSKLSPEDAIAWMHYATHNDTPWSGLKGKTGAGVRNQGGEDEPSSLRQIHELDQIEGAVEGKVEQGMKRFDESELKVGDVLYTPQGTAVTIYEPGIRVNKKGESLVYGEYYKNGEVSKGHIKLDALSLDNPLLTRDQGPSLGPLDSEQKKLSRVNPVVGEAFTSAFNTRDRTMGELSSKLAKVAALSETNKRELLKHLENESDSNTLVQPPAHLAEAYAQMRNEFIPEVPQMFNNAGFGIRTAKGFRAHGQNPTYMMLHHISPDVRETLTTKQGSPEYAGLKKDFIDWTRDYLIRAGMNPADATTQAVTKFEKEITEYNRKPDAAETLGFAGVRKPEGATLPPSWRSDDLMGNLSNYIKRSATDFASQTHIESSPEVMAALGAKKFGADKEIDPVILQATPNIVSHPVLQNVLRDYHGRMADNSTLADVGRVVSPLALGPISRSVDVMTTGLKGLAYLRPSEYVDGAINFAKGLTEWSALMSRSHQSGLNRLNTGANMRHVMGVGDANVNFMTRFASGLNKFTGLDKLESGARAIAQNWGETIVAMKRQQALAGDAKSVEFLDTLSKDWRSRDDLDLAAQVGRLLQGSYDTRQLPGWMLDGGLAPFLTWSKWSAGQLQAFNDFAVAPLFKGDVKPLVGQLLIGVLGGSVVQQVQEWMNNRQTRDVNWKELEAWADQNKGALGAPGSTLLASKLLTLSQRMGTFGFAGDLVKGVVEAAAGQNPQGVLHNPAIEGIFNTSKYGAAAIAAISSGEDVGAVLGKLTKDLAVNNSQVVRAARNWVDADENLAYNDRRRQNLFNFLRGEGAGANTFAVSYKDLAEKEFDKTKEPADMVAQAGKLLEKAATDATSQEDFVARLRKLGTSQNSIMPNPRRQPDKAFKYLKWVHDAEGADESSSTQRRWQEEDARAKYRKALVSPGSAGAR